MVAIDWVVGRFFVQVELLHGGLNVQSGRHKTALSFKMAGLHGSSGAAVIALIEKMGAGSSGIGGRGQGPACMQVRGGARGAKGSFIGGLRGPR